MNGHRGEHLAAPVRAYVVEREPRQRRADALALEGVVDLGVGEDDEVVGRV